MKKNYVITMLAAAGLLLMATAPSFATCPTGLEGTQLASGLWTIKIEGFATDNATCGSSCPDPTPVAEGCFGVIESDGACDITAGDVICAFNNTITSPTTVDGVPAFAGTVSSANDVGSYSFNSNNTGSVVIEDLNSGKVMAFGVVAALGNLSFQGASTFTSADPTVQKDPLILTIQKRDQTITEAQFESALAVTFDPAGGGAGGNGLGKGFDAVGVGTEEHLDPETGTVLEGGGSIFFNVDGGYDSDVVPGVQVFPSSLICDFHSTVLATNLGDGTQLNSAGLNSDYSCPLGGAAFQTASVLYGTTNGSAYTATTGSAGAPAHGLAIANATKAIMAGTDAGQAAVMVASGSIPHPNKTVTITNASTEPLDWTSITLNTLPDVTIGTVENAECTGAGTPAACCTGAGAGTCTAANCTGAGTPFANCTGSGTDTSCNAAGGDLAAWNPVATGSVKPICTITLSNSGASCNTGANKETGTYELNGADHAMTSGTNTSTGVTFSVTCE